MKNQAKRDFTISKEKRLLFNLLITVIPVLFFIFIELLLRVFNYGDNFHLFINHPDEMYSQYRVVNPDIGKKYFQRFEYTAPAKDIFLKKKPDNCFRIFVMGSSTVVGFPYEDNLMFSRILQERLQDAYPDKKFEVVNTAITAINTFTLLDFFPQILREEPDAILIYAGHNEFYGAFGVGSKEAVTHNRGLIRLHLKLMNLKVYQAIRNMVGTLAKARDKSPAEKRGTLMSRIVSKADIVYNSKDYQKGIKYFELNVSSMLKKAKGKNVPVFISDLVSNIKDLPPFKSIETKEYKPADYYFNLGKNAEKQGDYGKAYEYYTLARDYDCIRFRASSDINSIVRRLANEYKAHFVPTLALFEAVSPNRLIGYNLLTEHVHPNVNGQFLLADAFYQKMVVDGIIESHVNEYTVEPPEYYLINYGYTEVDRLIGYHRITNLSYHWPFRDDTKEYIDYRLIYQPVSYIDSLAFFVMARKGFNGADAHLKLAEYYANRHDYYNAFREYNALVKINPYWAEYYRRAADYLININDLPLALKYFNQSLIYEKSFYAFFRAGEIYLIKNDLKNAIKYFSEALELNDKMRIRVLTKLYVAYVYDNDEANAAKTLELLKDTDPGINVPVPPRQYTYINFIPQQTVPYIENARDLIARSDFAAAIKILNESLKIKDSHITNRMLGELYYRNKDAVTALFHLKKVYEEFRFDPRFLHLMIIAYLANDQKTEAYKCLEELGALDPMYPGLGKLKSYFSNNPHQ